ncbi:MAG: hypothetical protein ACTIJ9_13410 [Aequorivita sp.]
MKRNSPDSHGRLARDYYNWSIYKIYIPKLAVRATVIVRLGYTQPSLMVGSGGVNVWFKGVDSCLNATLSVLS